MQATWLANHTSLWNPEHHFQYAELKIFNQFISWYEKAVNTCTKVSTNLLSMQSYHSNNTWSLSLRIISPTRGVWYKDMFMVCFGSEWMYWFMSQRITALGLSNNLLDSIQTYLGWRVPSQLMHIVLPAGHVNIFLKWNMISFITNGNFVVCKQVLKSQCVRRYHVSHRESATITVHSASRSVRNAVSLWTTCGGVCRRKQTLVMCQMKRIWWIL